MGYIDHTPLVQPHIYTVPKWDNDGMPKRETLLFIFAATSALGGVAKILEFFGIKPDGWGRTLKEQVSAAPLLWGVLLFALSGCLLAAGLYIQKRSPSEDSLRRDFNTLTGPQRIALKEICQHPGKTEFELYETLRGLGYDRVSQNILNPLLATGLVQKNEKDGIEPKSGQDGYILNLLENRPVR
jgi:hypothetical protein